MGSNPILPGSGCRACPRRATPPPAGVRLLALSPRPGARYIPRGEASEAMHDRRRRARVLAVLAVLAACGRDGAPPPPEGALRLTFEDRAEPAAFSREGTATRDGPKGAAGLWAAVRGLPRPERALVENTANGRKVTLALFAASGSGPDIRLSIEAADALGITDPAAVRITALRSEPQIDTTKGRF